MLALSRALRDEYNIAAVTNDIFTRYPLPLTPISTIPCFNTWLLMQETEKTLNS